jgi:hypothetical protein
MVQDVNPVTQSFFQSFELTLSGSKVNFKQQQNENSPKFDDACKAFFTIYSSMVLRFHLLQLLERLSHNKEKLGEGRGEGERGRGKGVEVKGEGGGGGEGGNFNPQLSARSQDGGF